MRKRLIKSVGKTAKTEQTGLTFHIVKGRARSALCGKKMKDKPKIHGSFTAKMCQPCDKMFGDSTMLIGEVSFKY